MGGVLPEHRDAGDSQMITCRRQSVPQMHRKVFQVIHPDEPVSRVVGSDLVLLDAVHLAEQCYPVLDGSGASGTGYGGDEHSFHIRLILSRQAYS